MGAPGKHTLSERQYSNRSTGQSENSEVPQTLDEDYKP